MRLKVMCLVFISLMSSQCRMRRGAEGNSLASSGVPPLKPKGSFALVPNGISETGTCTSEANRHLRPTDEVGGWMPSNGDYVVAVPVKPMLTYYYHTANPYYGSSGQIRGGQAVSPHIWQSNFEQEVVGNPDGSYSLIDPSRQSVKFLQMGAAFKAQDGSRDYLTVIDANTIRVNHRDEVGSYDTYKKTSYFEQGFSPEAYAGSDPCAHYVGQSSQGPRMPRICKNMVSFRFLYESTTYATDQSVPVRVERNGKGRVTGVFNANNMQLLKLTYDPTGFLPRLVQDAAEIPNDYRNTTLQWGQLSFPLLSGVSDLEPNGSVYSNLSLTYKSNGFLESVSSNAAGSQAALTFVPIMGAAGQQTSGSIGEVVMGTFKKRFTYNRHINNGVVTAYSVSVENFVIGGTTPNTTEKFVLEPANCKVVEYIGPTGRGTQFVRNTTDPELIDVEIATNDNIQAQKRFVRRATGNLIEALDVVAIESAMAGSTKYHTDVTFDVDAASGLLTAVKPYGLSSLATEYVYDDYVEFPARGSRLTQVKSKKGGAVMDWVEYEYDSQTKRIWKVKHNGITAMTYAYSNPSSTGIPLKVTTTYESPALPPMSSIVDEFGDPTSIDQVGGIAMVREINPSLRRVEKITGFSTITPRYNLNGSPNHWRLDAISSNIQELEILRPNPLTTQYSYKGAKDDPSSRPSISETVIKNNGVLDQHTRQNIPIISNYNPASQP